MAAAKAKSGKASAGPRRRRQRKTRTLAVSSDDDSDSSSSSSSSDDDSDSEKDSAKPEPKDSSVRRAPSASSSSSSSSASSSSSSSSSSSDTNSSSESEDYDSASPAARRRTSRKRTTAPAEHSHDQATTSLSGKRRHVFRLTPEPELNEAHSFPAKKRTTYKEQALKALEPETPQLPPHLQRIVDAKKSSPSTRRNSDRGNKSNPQQSQAQQERRRQAFRSLWLKAVADEFGDELDSIRTREPTFGADGGTRLPLFIDALASGSELFKSPFKQFHGRADDVDELALASNL